MHANTAARKTRKLSVRFDEQRSRHRSSTTDHIPNVLPGPQISDMIVAQRVVVVTSGRHHVVFIDRHQIFFPGRPSGSLGVIGVSFVVTNLLERHRNDYGANGEPNERERRAASVPCTNSSIRSVSRIFPVESVSARRTLGYRRYTTQPARRTRYHGAENPSGNESNRNRTKLNLLLVPKFDRNWFERRYDRFTLLASR